MDNGFFIKEMLERRAFNNFTDAFDAANKWLDNTGNKIAHIKYRQGDSISLIQVINRHYSAERV